MVSSPTFLECVAITSGLTLNAYIKMRQQDLLMDFLERFALYQMIIR